MNMAFSGVAGSRPARGCDLADGDAKSTIKGVEQQAFAVLWRKRHKRSSPTPAIFHAGASECFNA
jgi:hypothetical protein